MPRLAQLVAASPLEAAIHDAYGKALGQNSYNLLGAEFVNADLGHYLGQDFAGEYLDHYTLREPKPRMPLYHLVGALDPLTIGDVQQRVGDGLPETLARVDRRRRPDASEDQAGRRRSGLGRRPRGGRRNQRRAGAASPRLHRLALLARLQREVRQRRVRARLSGKAARALAAGLRPRAIHRAAHAPRPARRIRKTACTAPPRSSRW